MKTLTPEGRLNNIIDKYLTYFFDGIKNENIIQYSFNHLSRCYMNDEKVFTYDGKRNVLYNYTTVWKNLINMFGIEDNRIAKGEVKRWFKKNCILNCHIYKTN